MSTLALNGTEFLLPVRKTGNPPVIPANKPPLGFFDLDPNDFDVEETFHNVCGHSPATGDTPIEVFKIIRSEKLRTIIGSLGERFADGKIGELALTEEQVVYLMRNHLDWFRNANVPNYIILNKHGDVAQIRLRSQNGTNSIKDGVKLFSENLNRDLDHVYAGSQPFLFVSALALA
jgi:hypothetical protein